MNYQDHAAEVKICFPKLWQGWSRVKRAQIVSQKFISEFSIKWPSIKAAKEHLRKMEAEEMKRKKQEEFLHHQRMWKIIGKAEQYYGDIVFEMCGGSGGQTEEETQKVFARIEAGDFDTENCMREALYAAYGHDSRLGPDWYDKVVKYWKQRGY